MKSLQQYINESSLSDIQQKLIDDNNKHKEEIQKGLKDFDSYLYLVVYDNPNQEGQDWYSHNDEADSIEWIIDDIKESELERGPRGENIKNWDIIKSWYLELWENNYEGDDILLKTWKGNL